MQILSSNLVSNGDFSQEGSELITNGDFSDGKTKWGLAVNNSQDTNAQFEVINEQAKVHVEKEGQKFLTG